MSGYSPENIFNIDETGQFSRAPHNISLAEVSKQCTGGKKSKERITGAFFVNAVGVKEKPIVIGKSKNPLASEQSGIRLNYPAQTSVSLKPGWILTS